MDWEWRNRSSRASSASEAVERRNPSRLRSPRARRKEKSALASRNPERSASVTSLYKRRRASASASSRPLPLPPAPSAADEEDPSCPAGSASFRLIPVASDRRRRRPPPLPSPSFTHSSLSFCFPVLPLAHEEKPTTCYFSEPTAQQGPEKAQRDHWGSTRAPLRAAAKTLKTRDAGGEEERAAAEMATRVKVKDVARRSTKKYVEEALYRRLFRKGSTPQAVREEVDSFLASRKRAFKWEVGVCVRRMRRNALYRPALKLSEVMTRRGMNPTVSDQAIYLDLIAKSRGIAAAEKYFLDLPETSKTHLTYGALLNSYCKELMTEKAEFLMKKMNQLNFSFTAMSFNSLMTMYTKINQPEKVPGIIQFMKLYDVSPDVFTYNVWMRALAALKDIPGVERVIEEMKRDGRVAPDWTTYSNLASIYVDAGLFEKAEAALKELEKRSTSNDVEAYQFLITLYGCTKNLVEVHRVWRSLKRNNPRMANMSYLNMIQVLANLKDLPAAEACFKEWEARHIHPPKTKAKDSGADNTSTTDPESSSNLPNNESGIKETGDKAAQDLQLKHPKYDIRVANAMIKAYITEGMLDKAIAVKKRAKMRGGRLNAKTWEIFMEHYLKAGDLKMAHWCADRAMKKGHSSGRIWVPPRSVTDNLMSYFEENKDVDGAEQYVEALKKVQKDLGVPVFEPLVRTYAAAGKKFPGMRQRLKMENVEVGEEMAQLLDSICADQ